MEYYMLNQPQSKFIAIVIKGDRSVCLVLSSVFQYMRKMLVKLQNLNSWFAKLAATCQYRNVLCI